MPCPRGYGLELMVERGIGCGPAASASASTGTAAPTGAVSVPSAGVGPLASYLVRTASGRADQVTSSLRTAGVQVTGESAGGRVE